MRILNRAVLVGLLVLLVTVTGRAAGVLVQGTIVDPAGAPIPGATVELIGGGKTVAKTVTAADGGFKFADVAAGTYDINVSLTGYRQTRSTVVVGASVPRPLRYTLQIGSMSETVKVASADATIPGSVAGEIVGGVPGAPPPPGAAPVGPAPQMVAGAGGGRGGGYGGAAAPYEARQMFQPPPPPAETYGAIDENKFRRVTDQPLSTFSIDVDTASYANVRRILNEGHLPPADAVRVEELINYFHFDYADQTQGAPFGVTTELAPCPWNSRHKLALVGLQAKRLPAGKTPPRNLVFLLDVSGSMAPPERLPMIKTAMKMLAETLTAQDRVAIVTYAGTTGVALPVTRGDHNSVIQEAISALNAGGSTNGGAGIQLAYQIAVENFVRGGINRVILATDGDFNVGVTDIDALTRLIEEKRSSGVFLSVLGVGAGNLKDATMEKLADKGNGNYAYLDSLTEARKVLVNEAGSTLVTVAKDVKIQVEFNPSQVAAYRLVGYENRRLKARDFNDDSKDAGEMGAGHSVTALYEIVPPGEEVDAEGIDPLKYQRPVAPLVAMTTVPSTELMTVKVRYKRPDGDTSTLVTVPVAGRNSAAPRHLGFAAAVAEFGMLLRESPFKADASWADVAAFAAKHRGEDPDGYRAEFVRLTELAASLDRQRSTAANISRR
jgi:Ca-activated chloride channel homolog